jgi:hypothetical protein
MIFSAYPILLQLADALPRKTVVGRSHGSRKQLRKEVPHKRKAAQSGPSASTSNHTRTTMEEIPDEQAGGLSRSTSMMSIESLARKVSKFNVHQPMCLIETN